MTSLLANPRQFERLAAVLGTSEALGTFLYRHPELVAELGDPGLDGERPSAAEVRAGMLRAVRADPDADVPASTLDETSGADALRVEYYRRLLRLAARDLTGRWDVDQVSAALADLAGATVEGALVVARGVLGDMAARCRLSVIGMGKTGGRELNYVSDVDVIFVYEPAGRSRRRGGAPSRHRARDHADASVLHPHRGGHHLARRRGAAARGPVGPARAPA
jgi:glutamate-ammonia-ligase adenylyltransferase